MVMKFPIPFFLFIFKVEHNFLKIVKKLINDFVLLLDNILH